MSTALEELALFASICEQCGLCRSRTQSVFARGAPTARLMIVGEAPGEQEDLQGLPFVGPSGELLERMLAAMQIPFNDVYICNAVKCRPPDNRTPTDDELAACVPYLDAQIEEVRPLVLLAMGRVAMKALGLGFKGRWRGKWVVRNGIPAIATYHPAYLLRNPEARAVVGQDLAAVVNEYHARIGSSA